MTEPSEAETPPRLSEELLEVLDRAGGKSMSLSEIVEALRGRGLPLVIILLCIPFLSPMMVPGLSIPFGAAIALCGLRIAFGREPWLPDILLRQKIPYPMLEKTVQFGCRFYGKLEKVIRPRMDLERWPGTLNAVGALIALSAVLLSLPIPPPFPLTNTIPGFAIICLSLGLLERDGMLLIVGLGLTLIASAYVFGIALVGKAGVVALWQWIY